MRPAYGRTAGGQSMTIGRWIILVALALAASTLPAHAAAPALPALLLTPGQDAAEAAPYIRYAKRPAGVGADTLDALLAGPLARITGPTIHFGPPGTRTVLFLRVRNGGSDPGSWIFTTGRGSLKYFRLYEVAGGRPMLRVDGTDGREARDNLRTYQAFRSELVLQPRAERLLLIDFLSDNSTYMPLRNET